MAISMLKIRRPLGRLIFNMGIAIPGKTVFLIETAPWSCWTINAGINSLRHGEAYMRQCIGSSLVQVMVCRLFGHKPLPEPHVANWTNLSTILVGIKQFLEQRCIQKLRPYIVGQHQFVNLANCFRKSTEHTGSDFPGANCVSIKLSS